MEPSEINDLKSQIEELRLQIKGLSGQVSRSSGYQNNQADSTNLKLGAQRFEILPPTQVASGSGSAAWTTVDLSGYVATDATILWGYFTLRETTGGTTLDGSFDVRQDELSSTYQICILSEPNVARFCASGLFVVTLDSARRFQYRISGTTIPASIDWTIELRGYSSSPVRINGPVPFAGSTNQAGGGGVTTSEATTTALRGITIPSLVEYVGELVGV